jgi:flavodoxin
VKALVVYVSYHHHNTEKVAKVIADTLKAETKTPEQIDLNNLSEFEIIGFGSGIYGGKLHEDLFELADRLLQTNRKKTFIFSTCNGTFVSRAMKDAKTRLQSKGFDVIGEFICKGFTTWGPFRLIGGRHKGRPNEEDLKQAAAFAENLKEKIAAEK